MICIKYIAHFLDYQMFRYPFIRLCLVVILPTIFLSRCAFDSNDEHFNTLAIPDPTTIGVSLNTIDLAKYNLGDTIDLYGTTSFSFSLIGNHGEIESATVFLSSSGNSWNHLSTGRTNSFRIDRSQLSNGTFVLRLDIIARTGSGSLADVVGAEKFNITQKWVVRVDVSPPQQPVPTLSVEHGFLTLQWPAYSKPNFQSYVVKRKLASGASQTFEIKDKQTNRWQDENYTGGHTVPIEYSLSIISEVGTATSVPIPRIDPIGVIFSFNTLDSTVTLQWKPTKFYGTFKDYKFRDGQNGPELTDINDTTLIYKLSTVRFGGVSNVSLTVRSKSPGLPEYSNNGTCKLGTPLPFTVAGKMMFNFYLNSVVAVDEDKKLLELDEQLKPVREIAKLESTNMKMPYPGKYVYSYSDNLIYRLKLEDNSKVSYDNTFISSHTVASNGLICTEYFRRPIQVRPNQYSLPVWSTRVIDPADGSNVYNEYSNTTKLNAVISEDGKFIWANNKSVFRINGTTSELVGLLTGTGSFVGFRQDNSDEMMFQDGSKINIYDTNTLTLIRTINAPMPDYRFVSYDPQSKNMFWTKSGSSVYTVNIETGVTKSIAISYSASGPSMYIVNGLLIYNGNYIRLK